MKLCNYGKREIARMIDHTLLKADASDDQIRDLCDEAVKYGFWSVCVNPSKVALASNCLMGEDVRVCTVIGFPLGATTTLIKSLEIKDAVVNGADEVDVVVNLGAVKSNDWNEVDRDIRVVVEAAEDMALVKLILETSLLTDEEKIRICEIAAKRGADFVKTSTGFGPYGATSTDVKLLRNTVGDMLGVKASGGIKDVKCVMEMIEAGANRIGTSAGRKIAEELERMESIH